MVTSARAPRAGRSRVRWAVAVVLLLAAIAFWARSGTLFGKQYEYEEDLTIALDGSATLTINSSIAALVALRGLPLDPSTGTVDRDRIRAAFESPVARVVSVPRPWRRSGRSFAQINLQVPDVRRLHELAPLSWSRYQLTGAAEETTFRQSVGASALKAGRLKNFGWDGSEVVAFRLHLPSRILHHNARDLENNEPTGVSRGNILAWEQHLADRLEGVPIQIEVRMESRSILYRTLWLFGGAFAAAVLTLAALIWWTVRKGKKRAESPRLP